jgi:hypothetical protein
MLVQLRKDVAGIKDNLFNSRSNNTQQDLEAVLS